MSLLVREKRSIGTRIGADKIARKVETRVKTDAKAV